jgi:hypothetical protein
MINRDIPEWAIDIWETRHPGSMEEVKRLIRIGLRLHQSAHYYEKIKHISSIMAAQDPS